MSTLTANKTKLFGPWRHNCLKNVWSLILFHELFNIKIGLGNCQGLHFSLICILLEVNWFEVKCLQNIAGKLSKVPPTTWRQLFPSRLDAAKDNIELFGPSHGLSWTLEGSCPTMWKTKEVVLIWIVAKFSLCIEHAHCLDFRVFKMSNTDFCKVFLW